MNKIFYTRTNQSAFIGISVGYLILFTSIGLPLLLTPVGDIEGQWGLLFPAILVLFFFYVLTASLFKSFLSFQVTKEGIHIRRPPFFHKLIPAREIKNITVLNVEESNKLFRDSMMEQEGYKDSADIVGFIRMLKNKSPAYRYLSVTPSVSATTVGAKDKITSLKMLSQERMILLELTDNQFYYLSPKKIDEFANAIKTIFIH